MKPVRWMKLLLVGVVTLPGALSAQAKQDTAPAISAATYSKLKAGASVPIVIDGRVQKLVRTEDPDVEVKVEGTSLLFVKGISYRHEESIPGAPSGGFSRIVATSFRWSRNTTVTLLAGYVIADDGSNVTFTVDKTGKLLFDHDASFNLHDVLYAADAEGQLDPSRCGRATLSPEWHKEMLTARGARQYKNPGDEKITLTMDTNRQWVPEPGMIVEVNGVRMKWGGGHLVRAAPHELNHRAAAQ